MGSRSFETGAIIGLSLEQLESLLDSVSEAAGIKKGPQGPSGRTPFAIQEKVHREIRKEIARLRAERAVLQEDLQRYADLFQSAPAAYVITNAQGKIIEANPAAEELFAAHGRRLKGREIQKHIAKDDRAEFQTFLRSAAKANGSSQSDRFRLATASTDPRWVRVSVNTWREGPRVRLRWLFQDAPINRATGSTNIVGDREMLAAIVEGCEDAIIGLTIHGVIFSWNSAAERLFGYTTQEMVGQSILKILPQERVREEKVILERIRRGEQLRHYRTVRLDRGGRPIDVSLTISPIRDERGRVVGVSKIIRDVTEQRRAEEALRDSESRFRVAYEHAPIGIEQLDLNSGKLIEVNDSVCKIVGYPREELKTKTFAEITHKDDLKVEKKLLQDLRANRISSYTLEKRYIHRDGHSIWVRVTSAKAGVIAGRAYRITVVQDIHDAKANEAMLRESEERMRAIVDTAVDAIITIDERGTVESANAATQRLFGYQPSEIIGRNIKMLMPEPYHAEHDGYLRNYVTSGEAKIIGVGREVTAKRKDGGTFPINLSVSEVKFGGRRLFTGIIHDLTQRRNLERQILDISESEQRRIGQDLHDGLCQYLVGIGFSVEMIAKRLEEQMPDQASEVRKIGQLMRNAATQARDLSHGLNPVGMGEEGLATALNQLAKQISELFQVKCTFTSGGPVTLPDRSSATNLYRIAQEATSNAIRHGHAQKVEISLEPAKGYVTLLVKDNGVGFAKGKGGGMGLQTMGYRARMMGGTLQAGSRPRGGAQITCRIPLPG